MHKNLRRNCFIVYQFKFALIYELLLFFRILQYTSLFRRDEQTNPSAIQGTSSFSPTSSDSSLSNMYRSPPRPLPYDADTRYFRLQRDGLVSRREKGSCHSQEEPDVIRSDTDADSEPLITANKWNESTPEDGSKEPDCKSKTKTSTGKSATGYAHIYSSSSEDEDVCPTCLEGKVKD